MYTSKNFFIAYGLSMCHIIKKNTGKNAPIFMNVPTVNVVHLVLHTSIFSKISNNYDKIDGHKNKKCDTLIIDIIE